MGTTVADKPTAKPINKRPIITPDSIGATVVIKVPIKKVEISDLSTSTSSKKANKTIENKFIILIGDFYYRDSAELLKKELSKKTQIDKFIIREVKI